jgi:phosphate transport system substrate-binding protein
MTVDYNPSGSTAGRKNFLNGTVDFAASDIPFVFHPEDGSAPENPAPGSYAYMPITAGGTSFMYNLIINGKRVTNLRMSGDNVVKVFTGVIKMWNDPAIKADNPGLNLPAKKVVPVVRSDGSGSSAQLTKWMIAKHKALWETFCHKTGRTACGFTSFYPTLDGSGMIAQNGDLGVSGYVSQSFAEGAIGYVNYSYALGSQFPVVKLLNDAGYYTEPTPKNVAVSLLNAKINTDATKPETYLTQDLSAVYGGKDPRNYELSSYSYLILPAKVAGQFNEAKGKTLGAFSYYAMCQAQQQSESLGYSPMPLNLVKASLDQIKKIPGVVVQNVDITKCKNPTFDPNGKNLLAETAPQPAPCDKKGPLQCPFGTGGLSNVQTPVLAAASGGTTSGGGSSGGASGGSSGGSTVTTTPAGGTTSSGGTTPAGGTTPSGGTTPAGGTTPSGGTTATGDGGSTGQPTGLAVGPVAPTTLDSSSGLSTSFGLILLIALFVIALVVGPALAWQRFSGRGHQ